MGVWYNYDAQYSKTLLIHVRTNSSSIIHNTSINVTTLQFTERSVEFTKIVWSTIRIMAEAKRFCYDKWEQSIASTCRPTIDANDNLEIDFNESNISSECEIFITNSGYRSASGPLISYDDCILQLIQKPDDDGIPPFGTAHFIFTAIYFAERCSSKEQIRFMFGDGRILVRTIQINYRNDKNNVVSKVNQKKCFYDIPDVFIDATKPTSLQSEIFDAVDCLVPAYDEMNFENYGARFHGLLYLEELRLRNEYSRLQHKKIYFRRADDFYELDLTFGLRFPLAIGKLTISLFK